jgi:hypothetical protein
MIISPYEFVRSNFTTDGQSQSVEWFEEGGRREEEAASSQQQAARRISKFTVGKSSPKSS